MLKTTGAALRKIQPAEPRQRYGGGLLRRIFPESVELLPNTNQYWELDVASGELASLETEEDLIRYGSFFSRVNGKETRHFSICKASPLQVDKSTSIRRQTFFDYNQFKTGYATHGLFPYRGKFHPQLVGAMMNVMGLRAGDLVLDPMGGSGTLAIEASIRGINSISVDVSPFCTLMAKAKIETLAIDAALLRQALSDTLVAIAEGVNKIGPQDLFKGKTTLYDVVKDAGVPKNCQNVVMLCYMDAVGYAARRVRKTWQDLYPVIVGRYLDAIERFAEVQERLGIVLGSADAQVGDARKLRIKNNSVDGIVTSPPYSFAIDYAENDRPQLQYLGADVDALKDEMLGLIGGKKREVRVQRYFRDMETVFSEMYRVLKPGGCCVVVIGSNEIQTGGIRHEVEFAKFAKSVGFELFWQMARPIEGIRNSMRDEYVMFFQK